MRYRNGASVAGSVALAVALAVPAATQGPSIETVAEGLDAPRGVAIAADGAILVAKAGSGADQCIGESEEPSQYATGFTNIIDIGFGPDGSLYVAEIVHEGLMTLFAGGAAPIGALFGVPANGGELELLVTGEQMMSSGGLAVADDGSVYVSTGTLSPPGGGAVVKVTP